MIILGLGTNLGNRQQNLENAIKALESSVLQNVRRSNVIETEALVPPNSPPDWRCKKFLNMAIAVELKQQISPQVLLEEIKRIEVQLGRAASAKWAPRVIDIDILAWDNLQINQPDLTIPHKLLQQRGFALWPLFEVAPNWQPAGHQNITQIMGIINLTPDSFSDGGSNYNPQQMLLDGANVLDVGAESTRPNATPITPQEELARLQPFLEANQNLPLSIDTRNYQTAQKALAYNNVKFLNDVSGFNCPNMLQIAAENDINIIAMHSLTVPADKEITLLQPPIPTLKNWFATKFEQFTKAGIKPKNIIFDVGIGFGKTSAQSLELIQNAPEMADFCHNMGVKILYGHSRKSFMQVPLEQRDVETARITRYLSLANVDFVRVHNVKLNKGAILFQPLKSY